MINPALARIACILVLTVALFGGAAAFGAEPDAKFSQFSVTIVDLPKAKELAATLEAKGFKAMVPPRDGRVSDMQNNGAVWIGKNVPLAMLQAVLPEAMRWNPYLQYFHVVGDRGEKPPAKVDNSIFIGGHIDSAMGIWKLNPIDHADFQKALASAKTLQDVHTYLHEKNIAREEPPALRFEPATEAPAAKPEPPKETQPVKPAPK